MHRYKNAAKLLLAQGLHPKVVHDLLRQGPISLTQDTCSHMLPHVQREAAEKMRALLPGRTVGLNKQALYSFRPTHGGDPPLCFAGEGGTPHEDWKAADIPLTPVSCPKRAQGYGGAPRPAGNYTRSHQLIRSRRAAGARLGAGPNGSRAMTLHAAMIYSAPLTPVRRRAGTLSFRNSREGLMRIWLGTKNSIEGTRWILSLIVPEPATLNLAHRCA